MGHHQLHRLPRTPAFKRASLLIGPGSGLAGATAAAPGTLEQIVAATVAASDAGLERAKRDEGLAYCLHLMATLARAATARDFRAALASIGVLEAIATIETTDRSAHPSPPYTVFELVAGFSSEVDRHLRHARARTDIGEMAQLAACESLSALCARPDGTLFHSDRGPVQESLRKLGHREGFAALAHEYFARFTRRYLEYHLSRELSNHVGQHRRFTGASDHNVFLRDLDDHCHKRTAVIRRSAGEWYGTNDFRRNLTLRKTKAFTAQAVGWARDALRL